MNGRKWIILWAACGLLVAACNAAAPDPTPTLIPTLTPPGTATLPPTATPEPGCRWQGMIEAWADTDSNGTREPDEPTVSGVPFGALYKGNQHLNATFVTGGNGAVEMEIQMPDCDPENYKVVLGDVPDGYAPPDNPALALSEANEGGVLHFGLLPADSAPVAPEFAACDVLNVSQAESVLGPLAWDPSPLEWIGPGALRSGICVFTGSTNQASIGVAWFAGDDGAKTFFSQSGGEPVSGIGSEAVWNEGGLTLTVRRGAVIVAVMMDQPENAKEQAIKLAGIAVVRVP